jgi:hypothetical protein
VEKAGCLDTQREAMKTFLKVIVIGLVVIIAGFIGVSTL